MIAKLYSALGTLGMPLIRHYLNRRCARGKEDATRLPERFGHASQPRPDGGLVWLHAASVGEVQSVLALARALLEQRADIALLVTTGTVTSAALLAQQPLPRLLHQYIPVDAPAAVKRFLDHWQPDLALWVESEFWPQLLLQTQARRIPMLLINARISARSAKNWQRWPSFFQPLLRGFDAIFASTSEDASRLRALGANQVIEAGNLKYDAQPLPADNAALAMLQRSIGRRPVWVAASTHAHEEQLVARAQQTIRTKHPTALCILIPRHANRGNAIAAMLRDKGMQHAQRSKNESIDESTSIYLADTMGELGTFFSVSPIAFLGGSLITHGGHNPLEPARFGCALLSGPHTHNFTAIMQPLIAGDALTTVHDSASLGESVTRLMAEPDRARTQGAQALSIAASHRGATQAILARINELLA